MARRACHILARNVVPEPDQVRDGAVVVRGDALRRRLRVVRPVVGGIPEALEERALAELVVETRSVDGLGGVVAAVEVEVQVLEGRGDDARATCRACRNEEVARVDVLCDGGGNGRCGTLARSNEIRQ